MPRLLPITKQVKDKRFLKAYERTGSITDAALEVTKIGSKGGKDLRASAASTGSQILSNLKPTLLEAYERKGITPDKIADKNNLLLDADNLLFVDKGLDKAIKVGVGGGYAAEKTQSTNVNLNVNTTPDDVRKYQELREKYTKELLDKLAHERSD